jgi:hypothetical protein
MENDLVLRIPHTLGAREAQKRIAGGIEAAKAQYGQLLHAAETEWSANRMDFRVSALAQTVRGVVDVQEEFVELRAQLPLVIRMLAKRFMPVVQNTGQKLLK